MKQPHFIIAKASIDNNGILCATFKEAGLGDNESIQYTLSAFAEAVYQCVNNGGGCPQTANKQTVSGTVIATASFSSGKNGQVTAKICVLPPQGTLSCPDTQHPELLQVTYSNVTLTDNTNNISVSGNIPFSVTFKICKKNR